MAGNASQRSGDAMARHYVFTITAEHVRNPRTLGPFWRKLHQALGELLPCDVGKRVYDFGDFYQVENDEQRSKRIGEKSNGQV